MYIKCIIYFSYKLTLNTWRNRLVNLLLQSNLRHLLVRDHLELLPSSLIKYHAANNSLKNLPLLPCSLLKKWVNTRYLLKPNNRKDSNSWAKKLRLNFSKIKKFLANFFRNFNKNWHSCSLRKCGNCFSLWTKNKLKITRQDWKNSNTLLITS